MENTQQYYCKLADYGGLVSEVKATTAALTNGGLERWYIRDVKHRIYSYATGASFKGRAGGLVEVFQSRPVHPTRRCEPAVIEPGGPKSYTRRSKYNIIRRVRPVLLALRKLEKKEFNGALAGVRMNQQRGADPRAALASQLKQSAQTLAGEGNAKTLTIAATGQTGQQLNQRERLPTGEQYVFPVGFPVERVARLIADTRLFWALLAEFDAAVLVAPQPAAPASAPNSPLLTPATIRTLYLKLLAHPTLVSELTAYQKSELRAYAESEALRATGLAVDLMDAKPQYDYPLTYQNGREVEYWQERIASYPDSQYVLRLLTDNVPLDTPGPSSPRPEPLEKSTPPPALLSSADGWAALLRPGVCFTLSDLDGLLVAVGLLSDTVSQMPTADFAGAAVLGVMKALRERRYLRENNNAKLARILAERYGPDAANPNTVARGTNALTEPAKPIYTRTLALLPAP